MIDDYAILPCNGLDKCAGVIAGELAISLCENEKNSLICPVFYRIADTKYNKMASEHPLLVIDGCPTRCASKLAAEKNLKIAKKVTVSEEAKKHNIELGKGLRILDNEKSLIEIILNELNTTEEKPVINNEVSAAEYKFEYEIHQSGKFMFRVPTNPEMFYNENDCWAYVKGNRARIGVTDFVQQNLSDILYYTPSEIGDEIDQFGAAGEIESSKSLIDVISPVSGKVVAINEPLIQKPELINENPYVLGWSAEIELSVFVSDKELLMNSEMYMKKMIKTLEGLNE
jgi:glycine cleavage system H protein